jgi:hypothetical protein
MPPAQELEMQRFTRTMWTVLNNASAKQGETDILFGPLLRSARLLAQRGFLTEPRKLSHGWHSACLTEAGREAITANRVN